MGPTNHDRFVDVNRKLEHKVRELHGLKCLYAHAYYTEDEFWDIYDRKSYEELRTKYKAGSLPTVYDKVKVDVRSAQDVSNMSMGEWVKHTFWSTWPTSGLYGVYRAAMGRDYLLKD
ncbi:hypothetical protein LTS18_012013 [Coniosporium uncinatum]|uniref:Uncharacterized protein n=1 Tax=Coniosporium uncinatum TaxID=93489 RepID=A0ACC3DW01_9PEZI|nr:hypothetical protein LTS18_012013 [Coniosporium uncinatum]